MNTSTSTGRSLMRGLNHDWLFAGEVGQKSTKTLSDQISERMWKEVGLEITPHQFRHAAAYIMLKADPGNYELVRRVLGHRSITTTRNFYIGLETLEATRQFGKIIADLELEEPAMKTFRRATPCLRRCVLVRSRTGRQPTAKLGRRPVRSATV